jgi:hypothetical protein
VDYWGKNEDNVVRVEIAVQSFVDARPAAGAVGGR